MKTIMYPTRNEERELLLYSIREKSKGSNQNDDAQSYVIALFFS